MINKAIMEMQYIDIPAEFLSHKPSREKMQACREYYAEHGFLDREICVDETGTLYDGYVGYLVLKENSVKYTEVSCEHSGEQMPGLNKPLSQRRKMYVFGMHRGLLKEYVWVVGNTTKDRKLLKVGNHAVVRCRGGKDKILITDVKYLDNPPREGFIKQVVRGLDE